MAGRRKKRRRAHIRRVSPIYALFSIVVIAIVGAIGISVFFRVHNVTVEGSSYYSAEEILDTAKIDTGNIIFTTSTNAAKQRLYDALPYLYSVEIKKQIPDTIVIKVNESEALAYVTVNKKSWLIDEHCKVLGELSGNDRGKYIRVSGITPLEPEVSKPLTVEAEEQTKLDSLKNVLSAISKADIVSKVTNLNVSNISSITFKYDKMYDVDFGTGVYADYKINKLVDVVGQLDGTQKGKIDLSRDGETRFIPE